MTVHIRLLAEHDINLIADAFTVIGWNKSAAQYRRYVAEQTTGSRTVFVAFVDGVFAGYITIKWQADYPPFQEANIPEIQDFNVLPRFRRQGLGSHLMDEAERTVAARSPLVGIGVGLYADYGTAQRMYHRRGYIPDGRGLYYRTHIVRPGESVIVDDDLILHFTKTL